MTRRLTTACTRTRSSLAFIENLNGVEVVSAAADAGREVAVILSNSWE